MEPESSWAKRPALSLKPPTVSGGVFIAEGFDEIILPALWEQRTFNEKAAGSPVLDQMWTFNLDFPDDLVFSAWRLRIFPRKSSVSDDFLPK